MIYTSQSQLLISWLMHDLYYRYLLLIYRIVKEMFSMNLIEQVLMINMKLITIFFKIPMELLSP